METKDDQLTAFQLAQLAASVLPSIVAPQPPSESSGFANWTRSDACPGILYEATRIAHQLWLASRNAIETKSLAFEQSESTARKSPAIEIPPPRRQGRAPDDNRFATWNEFLVQIVGHFVPSKRTETDRFQTAKQFLRYYAEHVMADFKPLTFRDEEILNGRAIINECSKANAGSIHDFLWHSISPEVRAGMQSNATPVEKLKNLIARWFSKRVDSDLIYTPDRFNGITLSKESKSLLQTDRVTEANRSLLVDAFPEALVRDGYESRVNWLLNDLKSNGLSRYDWSDFGRRFVRWWQEIGSKEGKRRGGRALHRSSK